MNVASQHDRDQAPQQFDVMFGDDAVDQEFRGVGKHQSRHPVDDHQHEAQRQQAPAGTHQFPDGGQDGPQPLGQSWPAWASVVEGELTAVFRLGWGAEGFIFAGMPRRLRQLKKRGL